MLIWRSIVAQPVSAWRTSTRPGGGTEAVYFHDDQRPARLDLRWEGTGLSAARLTHLDSFLQATSDRGTPFASA